MLQAVGRARAINRTADHPVEIDILGNLPLPLAIDTVLKWHAPSAVVQMVLLGLVLDSGADLALGWPEIWGEKQQSAPRAARRALERLRECGEKEKLADTTLLGILYKAMCPRVQEQRKNGRLLAFRYQLIGRQRWREGCFDPGLVPPQSLRDLLTDSARAGAGRASEGGMMTVTPCWRAAHYLMRGRAKWNTAWIDVSQWPDPGDYLRQRLGDRLEDFAWIEGCARHEPAAGAVGRNAAGGTAAETPVRW